MVAVVAVAGRLDSLAEVGCTGCKLGIGDWVDIEG